MILSDEKISELIGCKKTINKRSKRNFYFEQQSEFFLRNEFGCVSECGEYLFSVFMRKHIDMQEQFSIGLVLDAKSGEFDKTLLLRVNGRHEHKNKIKYEKFDDFHVHCANEYQIKLGVTNSFDAEVSGQYINFDSALLFFIAKCNIIDTDNCLRVNTIFGQIGFNI